MTTQPKSPSNIPREIAGAGSAPLKFNPQDPETANLVREFLAQKTGEVTGDTPITQTGEGGDVEIPVAPPQVNLPPNQEFDGGDPNQPFISEALAPVDKVSISDHEKELFLKAVLNDEPVRFPVSLYHGKMIIDVRSRSAHEQKRVFDVLKKDQEDNIYDPADVAMMITRMHYYLGALMVERINGVTFSELQLKAGDKLDTDVKKLRVAADKLFGGITNIRWTSILNALRVFEHKCAKMNSEAANEVFWNPQG